METLQTRLSHTRQDIDWFCLIFFEMCLEISPELAKREFFGHHPDPPDGCPSLLFPGLSTPCIPPAYPLECILRAAETLGPQAGKKQHYSAPLPPYEINGHLVVRRYDCYLVFRENDPDSFQQIHAS